MNCLERLQRLAEKYDGLPNARLTGKVVAELPEDEVLAEQFLNDYLGRSAIKPRVTITVGPEHLTSEKTRKAKSTGE